MRLLRIDVSTRHEGSHSRAMADLFQKAWFEAHPDDEFIVRDLAKDPVPHIQQETIQGFFTPPEQLTVELREALSFSDRLIEELQTADIVILSTPMHNFTLPSVLKAYFDHVIRINRTFKVGEGGHHGPFVGLLGGKQAYIFTASGAAFAGTALAPADALQPLLRTLFDFLGIHQMELFPVEGTTLDPEAFARTTTEVKEKIEYLIAQKRRNK